MPSEVSPPEKLTHKQIRRRLVKTLNETPQPIQIKPYKKIESKQLQKVLSDNRIDGGSVIPEHFGSVDIVASGILPFTRKNSSLYTGTYSLGEGPFIIGDTKLSGSNSNNYGVVKRIRRGGAGLSTYPFTNNFFLDSNNFNSYNYTEPYNARAGLKLNYTNQVSGQISFDVIRAVTNLTTVLNENDFIQGAGGESSHDIPSLIADINTDVRALNDEVETLAGIQDILENNTEELAGVVKETAEAQRRPALITRLKALRDLLISQQGMLLTAEQRAQGIAEARRVYALAIVEPARIRAQADAQAQAALERARDQAQAVFNQAQADAQANNNRFDSIYNQELDRLTQAEAQAQAAFNRAIERAESLSTVAAIERAMEQARETYDRAIDRINDDRNQAFNQAMGRANMRLNQAIADARAAFNRAIAEPTRIRDQALATANARFDQATALATQIRDLEIERLQPPDDEEAQKIIAIHKLETAKENIIIEESKLITDADIESNYTGLDTVFKAEQIKSLASFNIITNLKTQIETKEVRLFGELGYTGRSSFGAVGQTSHDIPRELYWLYAFYTIHSIEDTQAEADTALPFINSILKSTIEFNNLFYVVSPRNTLPIYLIEETFLNIDSLSDDFQNLNLTINNKKLNSIYTLRYLTPADLIDGNNFDSVTDTFQGVLRENQTGFRIFRIAFNDLLILDLDNLSALSNNITSNIDLLEELDTISIISPSINVVLNSQEVQIELRKDFNIPRPPSLPFFLNVPKNYPVFYSQSTRAIFRKRSVAINGFVTSSSWIEYQTYSYINQDQIYRQEEYKRRIEEYNEDVKLKQNRYNEDVLKYEKRLDDFNKYFERFSRKIQKVTIETTRNITNYLGNSNDITNEPNNPAVIIAYILTRFLIRADVGLQLSNIINIEEFRAWAVICSDNNLNFNGTFDFDTTIKDAINQVAFVGFSALDYSLGKIRPVINKRQNTVKQYFSSRNMLEFSYSQSFQKIPDLLKGTFINADKDSIQDDVYLYLKGKTQATAVSDLTISFFGINKAREVSKQLRFYRKQIENDTIVYSFKSDIDVLSLRAGDRVAINHFELGDDNFSTLTLNPVLNTAGRTLGVQIKQNNIPELKAGSIYEATILLATGVSFKTRITSIEKTEILTEDDILHDDSGQQLQTRAGTPLAITPILRNTLMFADIYNGNILKDSVVFFGKQNESLQFAIIDSIKVNQDLSSNVILKNYSDNNYLF